MRQITSTVVFPVTFTINVVDQATSDDVWSQIIEKAEKDVVDNISEISPVIVDCSDPEILGIKAEVESSLDTQSDYVQFCLQSLQEAKKALKAAVTGRVLLRAEAYPDKIAEINQELDLAISRLISSVSPKTDLQDD